MIWLMLGSLFALAVFFWWSRISTDIVQHPFFWETHHVTIDIHLLGYNESQEVLVSYSERTGIDDDTYEITVSPVAWFNKRPIALIRSELLEATQKVKELKNK